ncbi:hypothetical protein PL71_08985 [Pseudoalteromonas distincta]|uniref:DUF4331 domain-containing protein n=1 Tax=Pseudoalteromonas distincta TaxID=77608 RepID=A0ABT9GCY5_9GAMM|nr:MULTISPECIES: DUF4331 domain-containing protein [Pseudoalteromonas distincta group]KHM49186.1 hypothetical protein PL71_08985 [Pseudoalteromonas elyakovii]KID37902.1 hypothetical protein QT16_11425 [Pseudoalteromonas distincta]MDP4483728.1 DUF4331 domain-containing protein [Pseudoalteromonas elyakovii]
MKALTPSILAVVICSTFVSAPSEASSHREAPNISRFPTLDSTDFYVFNSYEQGRDDYVTLIANYIPLQDAYGGPNYFAMDPDATYSIHIDNDGDAVEDITFAFNFKSMLPNDNQGVQLTVGPEGNQRTVSVPLKNVGGVSAGDNSAVNFSESYTVSMISGAQRTGETTLLNNTASNSSTFSKPLDYVGNKTFGSMSDYQTYADQFVYQVSIPKCESMAQVFVGQRKDPFVVNLGKTFDLVNYVPVEGDSAPGAGDGGGFPGGITQSADNDDLADKNVTSIAIEIPKSCIVGEGNGVIGSWTTASLPQARVLNPNAKFANNGVNGGALTQVSRLGSPLVNELVIGIKDKDTFSTAHPKDDAQFLDYVSHPALPELLNILFKDAVNTTLGANLETLAPTNFPRTDLITAFLTGFAGVNQQATVTPSEMLRLNTGIAATAQADQSAFGVAGNDLAGFPNGRRPGDDVVDIALRVVMGRLCHPIPVNGEDTDLGLCAPEDANTGTVPFTDGAPIDATMMNSSFPYLATPLAGSK